MVLTRRGYKESLKEIIRWLPNEAITEIIQHTSRVDQVALCRVSKLFHGLCLPVLNRVVHLNELLTASAFLSSLIDNPTRAESVRSFSVFYFVVAWQVLSRIYSLYSGRRLILSPGRFPSNWPEEFSERLLTCLILMLKLEQLSMHPYMMRTHHMRALLEQRTFPRLLGCDIIPRATPTIDSAVPAEDLLALASFLTCHPTLTRLRVPSRNRIATSPAVRMALPNLEYYDGPAYLVPRLVTCRLKGARLWWQRQDETAVEHIIAALGSLTRPDIPFHYVHEYEGDYYQSIQLVTQAVATHIPQTRTVLMRARQHANYWHRVEEEETIDLVTACLQARFKPGLVCLALGWCMVTDGIPAAHQSDWGTVERWARACPTLEVCCLNNHVWRKGDDGTWQKFPMMEFCVLAGVPDPGIDFARSPLAVGFLQP
ncbi:hypothetical protein B0H10DRAFT_2069157 [Mycena sp. CBHHK59/15]|nr:hypothetical protein B0H10DRAFT_2069157 [Mycena sp. CBHHK59/15]